MFVHLRHCNSHFSVLSMLVANLCFNFNLNALIYFNFSQRLTNAKCNDAQFYFFWKLFENRHCLRWRLSPFSRKKYQVSLLDFPLNLNIPLSFVFSNSLWWWNCADIIRFWFQNSVVDLSIRCQESFLIKLIVMELEPSLVPLILSIRWFYSHSFNSFYTFHPFFWYHLCCSMLILWAQIVSSQITICCFIESYWYLYVKQRKTRGVCMQLTIVQINQ